MKKYELTSEVIEYKGHTLHRIKALKNFGSVKAGELGGWIESEENLSQADNAWIYDEAMAFGSAKILGNAKVFCYAKVHDCAEVYDNAEVSDNALVYGDAKV